MSRRLAPSARRMPISRVRSVTVASMMFMMPMPPTTSDMAAISPRNSMNISRVVWRLLQQLQRHGHAVVGQRVVAGERVAHDVDRRQHHARDRVRPASVIWVSSYRSRWNWPGLVTTSMSPMRRAHRGDRNVNVARKILGRERAADAGRRRPRLHHADDLVEVLVDHDLLADGIAERKQPLGRSRRPARSSCAPRPGRRR